MEGLFIRKERLTIIALLLMVLFQLEGCVQMSKISTVPEGAQVLINGAPLGSSPIFYSSRSGVPKTYFLTIEKPGYQRVDTKLESAYRADATLLFLLPGLIPYVFTARLEDEYMFSLQPEKGRK